ncbi:MAG TPA: sulfatase [Thermomicrobiales bacterium]|nr:sulfatase [Thermomicrobiales bacterium]
MNIFLVLIDSLNRQMLSAYAPSQIATPNLDAFAWRAWRFDNHFVGSLPCMPARREIFAGFKEVTWRPWGPLEPFDARLPKLLESRGYATALVTDHYHYWEEAANGYIQSFQSAELIRGHELDNWQPLVAEESLPEWVQNIEVWRPGLGRRYYSNVADFRDETDFFPAKVMTGAAHWLDKRPTDTPFFLQVESFDVHEPFDVPEPYVSMYGDGAARDRFNLWPPYQHPERLAAFMDQASPEELEFIRSQYAGKLTMVDRWFGELVGALDRHGLWDDTMVIVTTDHGHDLGERGAFGKQYPHFDSHANIPLFVWHPDHRGNGETISALTSTVDLFGTVLDAAEMTLPERTHSRGILPLISGDQEAGRSALLYGTFGQGLCCTDGDWTLLKAPEHDGPLNSYSSLLYRSLVIDSVTQPRGSGHFIPGVELAQWQVPITARPMSGMSKRESYLFHRREDPDQAANLLEAEPKQRRRMLDLLGDLMEQEGTPPEQYDRLGLGVESLSPVAIHR